MCVLCVGGGLYSWRNEEGLPYDPITVPVRVLALERVVEVDRPQEPRCLLEDTDVLFTCVTEGFPRPLITFRNMSARIFPGMGDFTRVYNVSSDQVCASVLSCGTGCFQMCSG